MWRAGIIGCGRIGCVYDCHARAYKECPQTELVAVCDTEWGKASECVNRWDVPRFYYDSPIAYMLMLQNEHLDIVSVCTPPETHCQIVCDMAPYVKAIYCEKPIATTIPDAEKMIKTCHKNKVILQINHQRRFGIPTFYFSRGIENTGTHMFDLLRMYFGDIKLEGNKVHTPNGLVIDIVEVDTKEPVFEFKVPPDWLIRKGVEHLVECLEMGKQSISSGEEALESLRLIERFKESSSCHNG